MRISSALIGWLTALGIAVAQSTDSTNAKCIERLEIPRYPALAESARLSASVSTSVRLNADGAIQEVVSQVSGVRGDAVIALFMKTIEDSVNSSAFLRSCGGHTISLVFQFCLGEQIGTQQFVFGYPNRFTVVAPTRMVDHAPVTKRERGKS